MDTPKSERRSRGVRCSGKSNILVTRSGNLSRCTGILLISLALLWPPILVMGQTLTNMGETNETAAVPVPINETEAGVTFIGGAGVVTENITATDPMLEVQQTMAPTEEDDTVPIATILPTLAPSIATTEEAEAEAVITLIPTTASIPLVTMEPTIITSSPTIGATTMIPDTENPTFMPTLAPTNATLAPTNATLAPTNATLAPTFPIVTQSPSLAPTNATMAPTNATITMEPTLAPTNATSSPTVPTMAPTNATLAPTNATLAPTVAIATDAPTSEAPTAGPTTTTVATGSPTAADTTTNMTLSPTMANENVTIPTTEAPTIANVTTPSPTVANATETEGDDESASPTKIITFPPTETPTVPPDGTPVSDTVQNLEMTLVGLNQVMSPDAKRQWKIVTEEHTTDFYSQNVNQYGIVDVVTTVVLLSEEVVSLRRTTRRLGGDESSSSQQQQQQRRQLQASVRLRYNQEISYVTPDPSRDTAENVVTDPFTTQADLDTYLASLQEASPEFDGVTSVQPVEVAGGGDTAVSVVPPAEESGGLGTGAVIGIVVAAVVGVVLILGLGYYVSQRGDDGGYVSTGKTPPSQLDVNNGPDEVSTLAEPHTNNRAGGVGNAMSGESIQGYGDQSVATVDYDYSKAYGGGGDTSVSSAGGTFGSQTHTQAAGGATLGGATGASNGGPLDTSFSESGSQFRGQNANVREELIDIYAPPGKLGVVIDTPDDGAPVVHAVKDSSVIADKLQVGDKLVAVDDEDVRSMTAIKVSKLISRKSANASRKLSIIRTVVVDE